MKPLTLIPKLKSKLKKGTSIIGFLSHVQGDLKQKAHAVGCAWYCRAQPSPRICNSCCDATEPRTTPSQRTLTDFCVRRTALVRHIRTHDQETRSTVVGDSLLLSLARRPSERTPAEQVDVQMKYGLSRTRADVEYRSVALFDISLACDLCCG